MSNSINDIKLFFDRHKGLQRDNRYSVSFINLPQGLEMPDADMQTLAVAMGSRAIDAIADNLVGYGPGRMVPRYQKFVGGVMLSIPVTNDNFIIEFFNQWFNKIYAGGRIRGNERAPFQLSYYNEIVYPCKMDVKLLDPNGNVNKIFRFHEVFPLENLPITVRMDQPNQYVIYQVLMNYREFEIIDG